MKSPNHDTQDVDLSSFFDTGLIGMAVTSLEKGWLNINDRLCEILGYSKEELLTKTWAEVTYPDDLESDVTEFNKLLAGEKDMYAMDKRFIRKDGVITHAHIVAKAIRRPDGSIDHFLALVQDINKRVKAIERHQQAEKTLRQREREREHIFSRSIDLQCIAGFDGYFKQLNPAWEKALGWSTETLLSKPYLHFVHEDEHPLTISATASLQNGVAVTRFENRYLCQNGTYRWLSWTATPILEESIIIATARDVTEERQMRDALHNSEARFRRLAETAQVGIFETKLNGEIIYLNPAFAQIFKYPTAAAVPQKSIISLYKNEEDRRLITVPMMSDGFVDSVEVDMIAADGSVLHVLISGTRHGDTLLGTLIDITQRKEALKKLEISNQELEQFAYIASHDLQEPLRMVTSYLQLLQKQFKDQIGEEANVFIHYAVEGAERMRTLIQDLLTFSRVTTRPSKLQEVDMNLVLSQALHSLEIIIDETNGMVVQDELPIVQADKTQMYQLFQNLIGNAIKFRSEDTPHIKIEVQHEANEWLFSVTDNGIGIAPNYQNQIFDVFRRLHTRSDYPGNGIGLALCKRIVGRHYGRIWVESPVKENSGTTIYFSLPILNEKGKI